MQKVYFDSAATTQVRPEVIDKMTLVLREDYGNPSSTHGFGRSAKNHIEQARKNIAKHLGVKASEIIFTSGGTEADNLALNSAVRDLGVKHIITSKIEHHAVLHTVQEIQSQTNISISYVNINLDGSVDYNHLEKLLVASSDKTLVSLMHVNNEVGTILDIDRVGNLCMEQEALFHSDMVQSIGHLDVNLSELQVDFTAVSAHKFHGPKGVGFAYIKKNSGLKPLIYGGEQERGYRGGTEGVHNIAGMDEALRLAYEHMVEEKAYISNIKQYFIDQLKERIDGVKFNANCCDLDHSTYTLINVCLPISQEKSGILLFQLDIKGIACSKGSACQSGSGKGSHVLTEILSEEDMLKPSIRFSFSKYNTKEEVDYVIGVLKEFIED
ncbi:cysteine desulfurase [Aquimarina sp. BL5]|uniref:cysteine desulfurase family protein n=1 Tax=Aquimarina sp. BL5 TaxID=1714860 RepID=UPI000E53A6DE|nr:cysteine desulfurase family protein [Aquimarina sp. BL5]AXT53768.1 cysteine desulfurase [Aquimarina sp. BL5]RKN03429.1 aminotransferase class V-fold PLP-dependent enzyme [Aquimarina sp. BL5]